MNRRGFLSAILAAGIAPAVCKAANLMPVFVRRESGLLLPTTHDGAVITLFDALGQELAKIPMIGAPASQGRLSLSGHSPVLRTGTFHHATADLPGWGKYMLDDLKLNTRQLMLGNDMSMDLNVSFP